MRMRGIFIGLLVLLAGCSAPSFYTRPEPVKIDFRDTVSPVVTERLSNFIVVRDDLEKLRDDIEVDVKYYQSVSVSDFFLGLSRGQINFAVDLKYKHEITVPRWKGSLKGLLKALQRATGLFFYSVDGQSFVVRDSAVCSIRLMFQDQAERMRDLIENTFDADDVFIDNVAGSVVFRADSNIYLDVVDYFRRYPVNLIELEVVFLETELSSEKQYGIDFQKIQFSAISGKGEPSAVTVKADSGFNVSIASGAVSMFAVLQSLEKYNHFSILQRATVGGLSGKLLRIDVSEKVPYVAEVTSVAGQSGPAVRGFKFGEASSGMTLEILPVADSDVLLLNNDLRYQTIVDFLRVGSLEDAVQSPIISVRNLKSYVTMRPGDVSKIATVRYYRKSNNASGLLGLSRSLQGNSHRRYEINVLVRAILKRYVFE